MIRVFRVNGLISVLPFTRNYNVTTTGTRRTGSGGGVRGRMGSSSIQLSEPQLVAKLLELFPLENSWIPVSKWAQSISDEVKELLVAYNGLGNFVGKQNNFFIVRTENGVKVVSLTTMGMSLCQRRQKKWNIERVRSDKFGQRRDFRRGSSNYHDKK
ncbi:unnamed protein product [Phytomonas sp. Hart1]|nr:unnamed protein product [Phytomonas sp. Hart1]|eukprot:CCW66105.1 unnamed protein product [Phytomonas sp. isolate Hart1]